MNCQRHPHSCGLDLRLEPGARLRFGHRPASDPGSHRHNVGLTVRSQNCTTAERSVTLHESAALLERITARKCGLGFITQRLRQGSLRSFPRMVRHRIDCGTSI
jgi:hypothetical protein